MTPEAAAGALRAGEPGPAGTAWDAAARALRLFSVTAAAVFVLAFLGIALLRLRYPFELEWMEGGSLEHVRRVLAGRPLYGPPGLEFIPFFYAPLYYYVGAAAAALLGLGFPALRLVSLAASIGCLLLVFAFVRRESGDRAAAWLATGLFAATYPLSGAWFDLARADSLFLFLLLLGAWGARFWTGAAGQVLAAAALAAAFITKQTALLPAAALAVQALLWDRRRARVFVPALAALTAGAFLTLDALHGGWYRYYTLVSPSRHPLVLRRILLFATRDLSAPLALAVLFGGSWLALARGPGRAAAVRFHGALAAGTLAAAALSRANVGGFVNVLMPAHASVAILFGLGVQELRRAVATAGARRGALLTLLWLGCALQLVALTYDPRRWLPSARDREAGQDLTRRLAAMTGEVFVPGHPYLLTRAGRPAHTHFVGINETLTHGTLEVRTRLAAELGEALRAQRYAALVLDSPAWFAPLVAPYYRDAGPVFSDPDVFWPVTGARLRPERIYVPRSPGAAGAPASASQSTNTSSSGR